MMDAHSNELIGESAFEATYKPLELAGEGDQMVQTYRVAQDAAHLRSLTEQHIWAIIEDSETGNLYASPGYHLVNVVGFIVTEHPWESSNLEAVWFVESSGLDDEPCSGMSPG